MAFGSIAVVYLEGLISSSKIYDPLLATGMALTTFIPCAIVMLIGFILMKVKKPKWKTIIAISWVLFIILNFFMIYSAAIKVS